MPPPREEFDDEVAQTERALMIQLKRVLEYVPVGTKDLLRVLTHPDVIDLTEGYIRAKRLERANEGTRHPNP